jgi:hypothetical protein
MKFQKKNLEQIIIDANPTVVLYIYKRKNEYTVSWTLPRTLCKRELGAPGCPFTVGAPKGQQADKKDNTAITLYIKGSREGSRRSSN